VRRQVPLGTAQSSIDLLLVHDRVLHLVLDQ